MALGCVGSRAGASVFRAAQGRRCAQARARLGALALTPRRRPGTASTSTRTAFAAPRSSSWLIPACRSERLSRDLARAGAGCRRRVARPARDRRHLRGLSRPAAGRHRRLSPRRGGCPLRTGIDFLGLPGLVERDPAKLDRVAPADPRAGRSDRRHDPGGHHAACRPCPQAAPAPKPRPSDVAVGERR